MHCGKILLLFISIFNTEKVLCENILIVEDVPSPSHQIYNGAVAEALASNGYNVTIIRPGSIQFKNQENLHSIILEGSYELITSEDHLDPGQLSDMRTWACLLWFDEYSEILCNHSLHTKGLQTLMNYPNDFKFDLIIYDMTMGLCLFPLIQKFNYPPVIGITPFLLPPNLSDLFGNGIQPSYIPFYTLSFSDRMNFWERVQNNFWTILNNYMANTYTMRRLEVLARQKFGNDMHSFESLRKHVSLLLCNYVPGFHYPRPLTPNIIPVGGLHIKSNRTLPRDLQEILDNAENGAIFFSLGSNLRSDQLSMKKRNAILKAFSELKQIVLWKFESELSDLPKDVIIRKWLPQEAILAHPNLKLFISHGGGLSTIEATHFGVPVLGIPFYMDQLNNVDILVKQELGIRLDYSSLTSSTLLENINELLRNPKYIEKNKKLSKMIRDQPQTPLERALFWIEYTMRHNGTDLLQPRSRELSPFVSNSFDIYLFFVILFGAFSIAIYKMYSSLSREILFTQSKVKKS